MKYRPLVITLFALLFVISACTALRSSTPTPTLLPTGTPTVTPTDTATPTETPTPLALLVMLVRPGGTDAALADALEVSLRQAAEADRMRWQVREALRPDDVTPELHLLVLLPGVSNAAALIAAADHAQILAIGIPGLESAPNLTTVQLDNGRPDQLGFMAGFIATMLTPDYRSGMVGITDDTSARAAYLAFLNGDTYYCGLCLQSYPPFYSYPLYVEAPRGAAATDWWGNGEFLKDHQAGTVFIYPGAGDDAMLQQLAGYGINLIGTAPPPEALRANWVASLRTDPLPTILALIPALMDGQSGQSVSVPLQITDVNPDLFSPGRQHYANEVLADLLAGFTDTGVDPSTGELK
ncbi:MAG: hypothetical protein ACOYYS_23860 [Chloroflexota bacterium]